MPGNTAVKLTMRSVDALSTTNRDALFWDRDLPGFGLRVYRSGRKVYIVQARGPAGAKRAVVGRHGEIRADAARRRAVTMIDRIKRGEDPVAAAPAPEPTVADLAERYMRVHVEVDCRPKTVETFGRVVRLQDPHQGVHDLRRREELARLRAGVVGELLYEVLVGPAQHIGRHAAVRQIVLIKVLDQRMHDFIGD